MVTQRAAVLRRATGADAAALTRLEKRSFTGYYATHRFSLQQFRYYLARSTTIAHVIEAAGEIAAYSLGVRGTRGRRHVAQLHSIATDPSARARHLGRRLLRAFVAEARRRGCRVAYLEVAARNRPAIALFTQHDFVSVARLARYYSPSTDGLRMRRRLEGVTRA